MPCNLFYYKYNLSHFSSFFNDYRSYIQFISHLLCWGRSLLVHYDKTWLKVNENYPTINVKNNLEDKDSIWYYYQNLIALRKSKEGLIYGDFKPVKANKNLMVFERIYGDEKYLVCVNLSKKTIRHNLDTKGKILINNYKKENIDEVLLPYESFIIEK